MNADRLIPRPVRAARVLLFAAAGLTAMTALSAMLLVGGLIGLGGALVVALPGVASLLAALAVTRRPARSLWISIIVLQVIYLFWQLGRISEGEPFGLLGLAFPVAILSLVLRPAARTYFR